MDHPIKKYIEILICQLPYLSSHYEIYSMNNIPCLNNENSRQEPNLTAVLVGVKGFESPTSCSQSELLFYSLLGNGLF